MKNSGHKKMTEYLRTHWPKVCRPSRDPNLSHNSLDNVILNSKMIVTMNSNFSEFIIENCARTKA